MIHARLFALALLFAFTRPASAETVDLLLVAADDSSLQPVLAKLTEATVTTRAAWTTWTGNLAGKRVALTRAEGDPLNAVAATTGTTKLAEPSDQAQR